MNEKYKQASHIIIKDPAQRSVGWLTFYLEMYGWSVGNLIDQCILLLFKNILKSDQCPEKSRHLGASLSYVVDFVGALVL